MHGRGRRAAGMDEDGVAVGLGLGGVLRRDVAGGADLVLDDDRLAGDRADLLGEVAHQHVGAAAGREGAHEGDVAARIFVLRLERAGRRHDRGRGHRQGHSSRYSGPTLVHRFLLLSGCIVSYRLFSPKIDALSFLERNFARPPDLRQHDQADDEARRDEQCRRNRPLDEDRSDRRATAPCARRRFSSISGPRMKPSSSGAGSQPSLSKT